MEESLTAFRFSMAMCAKAQRTADRGGPLNDEEKANLFRSAGGFAEHGFDAGLGTFFAVAAGNAH